MEQLWGDLDNRHDSIAEADAANTSGGAAVGSVGGKEIMRALEAISKRLVSGSRKVCSWCEIRRSEASVSRDEMSESI